MKITWYGHSCFKISSDSGSVVFGLYMQDYVPGIHYPEVRADQVLCSHGHNDHNNTDGVIISGNIPNMKLTTIDTFHDDTMGSQRGGNKIHVVEMDGFRIAHLGDLGHYLDEEQIRQIGELDVLLIPVGGHFTIDAAAAKEIAGQIGATVTIPMHYRGDGFGFPVLSTADAFAELYEHVEYEDDSEYEVKKGTDKKIVILKCPVYRSGEGN